MDGLTKPAFDAFSAFPIIQVVVSAMILLAGVYVMTRGSRDNATKPPELIPQWILIGPLHDMMGAVHDVAEETRRTNELLRDVKDIMGDLLRQSEMNKATLEAIRNESRMR
jgi:hypothetical protein